MSTQPPVVSVHPVTLPAPDRGVDLTVKVSAPVTGTNVPIVLLSHGFGSSAHAYGPLADYWAAHGFVVIQPTHLDSRLVGLPADDPRRPELWRFRAQDITRILDDLDTIEGALPGLQGRLDRDRVAAAGHSFGGQTAGILLGLRVQGVGESDLTDARVKAGVLLATAGTGGADLVPELAAQFPWLNPSFENLTPPTLVVAGDADSSPLTTRGPDWSADPYHLSPGAQALLTLFGAEHSLGGIPGYDAAETTDANPARVTAIQRMTYGFLRSALYPEDPSWAEAQDWFVGQSSVGRLDKKEVRVPS